MESGKVKSMVSNFKGIIEDRDITRLRRSLYEFLHLRCGFIAHYSLDGFIHEYSEPEDFLRFCEHLRNNGLEIHQCDTTDDYNYGYTAEEVKEAMSDILTSVTLDEIERETTEHYKNERYALYQQLKAEFGG